MKVRTFATKEEAEESYKIIRRILMCERIRHREMRIKKDAKIVMLIHRIRELEAQLADRSS